MRDIAWYYDLALLAFLCHHPPLSLCAYEFRSASIRRLDKHQEYYSLDFSVQECLLVRMISENDASLPNILLLVEVFICRNEGGDELSLFSVIPFLACSCAQSLNCLLVESLRRVKRTELCDIIIYIYSPTSFMSFYIHNVFVNMSSIINPT